MPPVMDHEIFAHALLDQAEGRIGGGQNAFRWEGQAWIGTDYDKLWLKSEGFALGKGGVEDGRHELLYDRAITTYVDLQAGVRTDWDSGTGRTWAALGVQGLAPSFFDYEATAYLSDGGTRRCASPRPTIFSSRSASSCSREIEMNFYSKADPGRWSAPASPTSMPACGCATRSAANSRPISASPMPGNSARPRSFARQDGESAGALQFVFGIRSWF